MSATPAPATESEVPAPKKKSKLVLFVIVGVVALLGAGGGGFYFLKIRPAKAAAAAEKLKKSEAGGEDPSEVKRVVELQPFIMNLADPDEPRYLRMTVSLGIGEEAGGEEKADPIFTTRVRDVMLAVLSTKKSADLLTNEGKTKLRKELLEKVRASVKKPEVKAIYITDFIIQM
jgi:flagellar FliL protein